MASTNLQHIIVVISRLNRLREIIEFFNQAEMFFNFYYDSSSVTIVAAHSDDSTVVSFDTLTTTFDFNVRVWNILQEMLKRFPHISLEEYSFTNNNISVSFKIQWSIEGEELYDPDR